MVDCYRHNRIARFQVRQNLLIDQKVRLQELIDLESKTTKGHTVELVGYPKVIWNLVAF